MFAGNLEPLRRACTLRSFSMRSLREVKRNDIVGCYIFRAGAWVYPKSGVLEGGSVRRPASAHVPQTNKRQRAVSAQGRHVPPRIEKVAPRHLHHHRNPHANMQASRTQIGRQLLAGSKRKVARESYRCFSCSIRQAQQQTPPPKSPQDGRGTTHFGFETVTEALKEQRGMYQPTNLGSLAKSSQSAPSSPPSPHHMTP